MVGARSGVRWTQRKSFVISLVTGTLLCGMLVGAGAASGDPDAEVRAKDLEAEVQQLRDELDVSHPAEEVDDLVGRIGELEQDLADAHAAADDAVVELTEREKGLERREAALDDREDGLDEREAELETREQEIVAPDAAPPQRSSAESGSQSASQSSSSGCGSGQVDINTAGVQELQRIHEIGPERAQQIVSLRPFRSVDDLVRVSGIAEGRLGGIKAQGVACVA